MDFYYENYPDSILLEIKLEENKNEIKYKSSNAFKWHTSLKRLTLYVLNFFEEHHIFICI